jgi:hypothetical protein
MNSSLYATLGALITLISTAHAQFIEIRLSFKVILDPVTGQRPAGITDNVFQTAVANANQWLASYWRGYRLRVTEVADIGGPTQGGANGPSQWYGRDFRDTPEPWTTFQNRTQTDSRYLLRSDQVNFYIATSLGVGGGGACPIPPAEASLLACQGFATTGPWWLVHETGHFFGLNHTHGGCGCDGKGCFVLNGFNVGDDGISDTLPEARGDNCFTTKDQLAQANFNKLFTNCSPVEGQLVTNTFYNVMSYHLPGSKDLVENILTEPQLDRHADTANTSRAAFVSGHTWFVSPIGFSVGSGSSTAPFGTVTQGASAADSSGGDIILLRPGRYNEPQTIAKAVTLRVTRAGAATIGRP